MSRYIKPCMDAVDLSSLLFSPWCFKPFGHMWFMDSRICCSVSAVPGVSYWTFRGFLSDQMYDCGSGASAILFWVCQFRCFAEKQRRSGSGWYPQRIIMFSSTFHLCCNASVSYTSGSNHLTLSCRAQVNTSVHYSCFSLHSCSLCCSSFWLSFLTLITTQCLWTKIEMTSDNKRHWFIRVRLCFLTLA